MDHSLPKLTTCLMFVGDQNGKAEEAIAFYISLFKNSRLLRLTRFGPGDFVGEGLVTQAWFSLDGQEFIAQDGGRAHAFSFTPATSIFVRCDTESEIDGLFEKLSEGGMVMMPLDEYSFSVKFGWIADKYGVSWQLSLTAA